jgi:hypothetical protein
MVFIAGTVRYEMDRARRNRAGRSALSCLCRNFWSRRASKTSMKRILLRVVIASITFAIGVACTGIWKPKTIPTPMAPGNCMAQYEAGLVTYKLREDDAPEFFKAFQVLPVYALPDCVDEAYSLTWIPSFHEPVLVQVWHSNDGAFMVAKMLNTRGWSRWGNIKEANVRPLTDFEWREFTELLNRMSYWDLPSTVRKMEPQDGALWLVDGVRSKQLHWVRRRVPDEHFAEICKHMIRLSGLETAHAMYLPFETESSLPDRLTTP